MVDDRVTISKERYEELVGREVDAQKVASCVWLEREVQKLNNLLSAVSFAAGEVFLSDHNTLADRVRELKADAEKWRAVSSTHNWKL